MGLAAGTCRSPSEPDALHRPLIDQGCASFDCPERCFAGRRFLGVSLGHGARAGTSTLRCIAGQRTPFRPRIGELAVQPLGIVRQDPVIHQAGQDFSHPTLHRCVNSVTLRRTSVRHAVAPTKGQTYREVGTQSYGAPRAGRAAESVNARVGAGHDRRSRLLEGAGRITGCRTGRFASVPSSVRGGTASTESCWRGSQAQPWPVSPNLP